HALTPGHGKTLVAAYLVGERGTIWHAVLLGVVTTLTHTSSVLVLAGVLWIWKPDRAAGQTGLGGGLGLAVACLGFWLLLRRLPGQADHVHLPGQGHHHHHDGHHHHHHGPADHTHEEHGNVVPLGADGRSVSWWGLIVLGMTGGLIPCWDAI